MTEVIYSHMTIDTILSELVGHDTATCIIDDDIESISLVRDFLGRLRDERPVSHVDLEVSDLASGFFAEV